MVYIIIFLNFFSSKKYVLFNVIKMILTGLVTYPCNLYTGIDWIAIKSTAVSISSAPIRIIINNL